LCRPSISSSQLSGSLADVAQVEEHIPKVVTCLRTVVDPFPKEMSNASYLVHNTVVVISENTEDDTESFAKVVTSFKPSDIKPLASIRHRTLWRKDARDVLERVADASPELITSDLPRWLANHLFDQNSWNYTTFEGVREQAFNYLTTFATERVLEDALSIVKTNEHYKVEYGASWCCSYEYYPFPRDLYSKLSNLLIRLKHRKALISAEFELLLSPVLIEIVLDYVQVTKSDPPISSLDIPSISGPEAITQTPCLIL